ncbi:MAG: DUF6298 domain-containing protein [Phycisphaerae bacterium]
MNIALFIAPFHRRKAGAAAWLLTMAAATAAFAAPKPPPDVEFKKNASGHEQLVYHPDPEGNRVIDYSFAGYEGGGVPIPDAPVRVTVPLHPDDTDATPRIQAAIDYVSTLPPDKNGIRGAVLLEKGRYPIASQLQIRASGVILRGQGDDDHGTLLFATGIHRRTLIQVSGIDDAQTTSPQTITDNFVPDNASTLHLPNPSSFHVGDEIQIRRPSTKDWIDYIGMWQFPGRPNTGDFRFSWKPGKFDLFWDRTITAIDGNAITLDAPLTSTLDKKYTAATVSHLAWPGRLSQVGIENLRCESEVNPKLPLDEDHSWIAIGMKSVENAWVRNVTSLHFASSCVNLLETCSKITVEDCKSLAPVSEIGGYRRMAFYTAGQRTLFLRCHSEDGWRDFGVGYESTGPTAIVNCDAKNSHDFSGTVESWANGVLLDTLMIPDNCIKLDNREIWDQGTGWSASGCTLWNVQAPQVYLRTPPGEHNWGFGVWGVDVGEGQWVVVNEWVDPDSLYLQQLKERLGDNAVKATERAPISTDAANAPTIDKAAPDQIDHLAHPPAPTLHPVSVKNGWLTVDNKLLTGSQLETSWWKGHIDPQRAGDDTYGPAITRFTPGRTGQGNTDDLNELTNSMIAHHVAAFAAHWGLWYDERRQDHEQVHRITPDVEPPFWEQAWARSGIGKCYDGLSKYDLTRYNPWYFNRLQQFSTLCDQKGLVFIDQMFFQHHVLEDVAHWMDVPWRVTNALQDVGFPEPPPTENRKRIFIANIYYDVTQPKVAALHRGLIRHYLDSLGDNHNVIHVIGEEYSGPLSFMQFWVDTVAQWEKDTGKHPLIGLSCSKDVQDAILADPVRSKTIDVIDMKYWWYTPDDKPYAPKGGEQIAPRKAGRYWKGSQKRTPESVARQVRDYRDKYPDKAIICSYDNLDGWGVAAAGGSMAPLNADPTLLHALAQMHPFEPSTPLAKNQWALANDNHDYLVYAMSGGPIRLDLTHATGTYEARWVDPNTGALHPAADAEGGKIADFQSPSSGRAVLWLTRK